MNDLKQQKIRVIGYVFDNPILELEFEPSSNHLKNIIETVEFFPHHDWLLESQDNDYCKSLTIMIAEFIVSNNITNINSLEDFIEDEYLGSGYHGLNDMGCRIIALNNELTRPERSDFRCKIIREKELNNELVE